MRELGTCHDCVASLSTPTPGNVASWCITTHDQTTIRRDHRFHSSLHAFRTSRILLLRPGYRRALRASCYLPGGRFWYRTGSPPLPAWETHTRSCECHVMHSDFEPPKRAVCPATSACMHSVCTWTASGRGRGTGRLGVMRLPPFDSSEGAHPGRLEARRTRYRDRDRFTLTSGAARDSGRQRRPVRHHPAVPWVRWITCRQPSQHHHQRQR